MCVKLRGTRIGPGSVMPVHQKRGISSSIWGFGNGSWVNARSERLEELYKNCLRGVIYTDSFWEKDKEFVHLNKEMFCIPVVLNPNNEFAILTRNSNNFVAQYHHRMPVLFNEHGKDRFLDGIFDESLYLNDSYIVLRSHERDCIFN